jgi:transposase
MAGWLGIDIAKEFHWVHLLDDSGTKQLSRRLANEPTDIETLLGELGELVEGPVTAGVDVIGGIASLVVVMLQDAGVEVRHVSGIAVNRARQGTIGGENKSDPRDAAVIADQVRTRPDLRPVEVLDEITAELRVVMGHRRTLVIDQTRRIARLHDLLVSVHPGLEHGLDLTQKADLWLLTRYVTPAELRRAGARRVRDHLSQLRHVRAVRIERITTIAVEAAKAQQARVPGETRIADLVREIAADTLDTRDRLAKIDREIEELLDRHPDAALIRTLPGMGATLTAEFLAEAGGLTRFPTADKLAAASGLAPVLNQSGRSHRLKRALGGNKTLKRVFYQSAFCSLSHPTSRAFYDRKRAEGKRHHQAVLALARRRVAVLHAMLRTRQPFNPDHTAEHATAA